jgi:histidinol-phosphatase
VNPDLALALELAGIADSITAARFRARDLSVDVKADRTPVTDADRDAEEAIRDVLRARRPAHAVLGEEFGAEGESEWRWLIDPIDGTRNYARGVPVWATLIALVHDERSVCAVVSAPALARRWWAARGEGAHSRDGVLRVSTVASLDAAHLSCTDVRDFEPRGTGPGFLELASRCRHVRAFGDFWSHMLVAEGALDIGIEAVVNPWDIAAAQVIVEEAGGRFSDFHGEPRIDSGNVITSNGLLHEAVMTLLGQPPG